MKIAALFFGLMGLVVSCWAAEMPQGAKAMGCSSCHAIDHQVVGPAWVEVSKRYRNQSDQRAVFERLVNKVSKGGSGNWGSIPMVANDPIGDKRKQVEGLVKFILALAK